MRSARHRDDAGFSMILVMGFMMVVGIIVVAALGVATNSLSSSTQHASFESALTVAESGIDQGLARLQKSYDDFTADAPTPDNASMSDPSPLCTDAPIDVPAGGFATKADEQSWARTNLANLAVAHPECIRKAAGGEYLTLKPANRQVVYAMGWVPSYANPVKTRVIKAEYIFAPFRPNVAVLTGGDLEIGSSTIINTVPGVDPAEAGIHSNGSITVDTGNPVVYGEVSASGGGSGTSTKFYSNPDGTVTTEPPMRLPLISPRHVYFDQYSHFSDTEWYDLCPDGKIMKPSSYGPCANPAADAVWADLSGGGTYLGWTFGHDGTGTPTWYAGKYLASNAVYYANGSNIAMGPGVGNPTVVNVTLIADAVDDDVCQKTGGTIDWDAIGITSPKIPDLFMLAAADLHTGSNFSAGSPSSTGMFVAGDQIVMYTSSNGAYGSVVAGDQCPSTGPDDVDVVKNPSIWFDPNGDSPFASIINTTLWLEE